MAPPPDSTAFVLVPGAWFPGSCYEKVTARLRKLGYTVTPIDLLSSRGIDKPPAEAYEDAALVRQTAADFMDQGKNVVVVGNSYGCFIAIEAMKGLSETDRQAAAAGKKSSASSGRLANMVLIASLVMPAGVTVMQATSGNIDLGDRSEVPFLETPTLEIGRGTVSDLPEDEAREMISRCRPQSMIAMNQPLTYEGYRHVPTTFVVTERDQMLPPAVQHEQVDALLASGTVDKVRKVPLQSDHLAMVSHPDEIVQILLEAAEV